jgi:hypothetical protein
MVFSWLAVNWFALLQTIGIVGGLFLVMIQIRDSTRQRESESLVTIYDINRQLLSLGFAHPKLFAILEDAKDADPVWEGRYLQLWMNQLSLIHLYLKRSVFEKELQEFLESEIADFITRANVQKFWRQRGISYPASFRKLVDDIIKKAKPPVTAAQVKPD